MTKSATAFADTKTPTTKERSLEPVYNDDGTVTIPLEYPIETITHDIVDQVTLKRPLMKHMKNMGTEVKMGELMSIASQVSDVHIKDFDKIDSADGLVIAGVVGDFLQRGLRIGVKA